MECPECGLVFPTEEGAPGSAEVWGVVVVGRGDEVEAGSPRVLNYALRGGIEEQCFTN